MKNHWIHRACIAVISFVLIASSLADVSPTNSPAAKPCADCHGTRACSKCDGKGTARCSDCGGDGKKESNCGSCGGRGRTSRTTRISGKTRRTTSTCSSCGGRGKRTQNCSRCGGDGKVTCQSCDGSKECARCKKSK